ncbi:MAG TPA: glycosyltransferase family 39 protein [Anaerolineales bacterium]|nr:glycosyltransferase family 39 protein [Anaerolineales bacterium]
MEPLNASTLSLLGVLDAYWRAPLIQRLIRGGLGVLLLAGGALQRFVGQDSLGYLPLALGMLLLALALLVRGGNALPALTLTAQPIAPETGVTLEPIGSVEQPAQINPAPSTVLAALRWPATLLVAFGAQILLSSSVENPWPGLIGYAVALVLLVVLARREHWLATRSDPEVAAQPLTVRWPLAVIAFALTAAAALFFTRNRFNAPGLIAWLGAVALWLGAFWQGSLRGALADARERLGALWANGALVRVDRVVVLLTLALIVGATFRLAAIDQIPVEMTSDHVEKLLDVGDLVIGGQAKIFFERNTGREPLQFYWTALVDAVLGTGVTFLSLKIGTALFGFLMLPSVYLLGRELEDETLGLLAVFLAAISFWAVAIARVGLRFPLSPLFIAPALFLVLRGLRTGRRNDFLIAGVVLGIGLYGYSPIRVLPIALAVVVGLFLLWPAARGRRAETIAHLVLLFATALVVFTPLLRYMFDQGDEFWYRAATRLTSSESPIVGDPLQIFLQNNWNALLMFNYRGDSVWVNTLPGRPVLDLFTGALFVLGAGFALLRLILKRDWRAAVLLVLVPVLLLPSTLSLAYPQENPSVVRAGGAIPVVAVLAAYPLWLLIRRLRTIELGAPGRWVAGGALAVVLGAATLLNQSMYFNEYPRQYMLAAQNASEIGEVIHDFANTFGSYDTAYVRPYPFWVDTRAVGMYAGALERDYAIQYDQLAATAEDPRPKLFILHRDDVADAIRPRGDEAPQTLPELQRLFPEGVLSVYSSARPDHDFLVYYVPGR